MQTANQIIISNQTMNTTINSPAIPLPNIYGFAIQAVYTGVPTGTLKLQASVDAFKYANDAQPQVPVNWVDIADSAFPVSSAGIYTWNYNGAFYTFVRLVYTDASGGASTAKLTATINLKGV
jgi:hypothetical protein